MTGVVEDHVLKALEAILLAQQAMNNSLWWSAVNQVISIGALAIIWYRVPPRRKP